MGRNRGGQHQRRPRLSLMGLAASTILIRSLSLKLTDWPLYLHELISYSMAWPTAANIWPREPSHKTQVTLANQRPMQGPPGAKPVHIHIHTFYSHIHFSLNPIGCFSFLFNRSFFIFCLNRCLFCFSPLSPLYIWPPCVPNLLHIHTSFSCRK